MAINLNHQLSSLTTTNQILQIDNSGNLILPSGTTVQRNPASGASATGSIRYNSTLCTVEYYDTTWHIIPQIVCDLEDFCFVDPNNVTKHVIYNTTSCCFELSDQVTNLTILNDLNVCNDVTICGANTDIKSSCLTIGDVNFTVASQATNLLETDGAGFHVHCANACVHYKQSTDTWNLNKNLVVNYVCGQISDISNHTTDDLAEGTNNLYYLDSRARAALCGVCDIVYDCVNGTICFDLDDHTTDDLAEGTNNLYYLDCRARNSLCGVCDIIYNSVTGTICFDLDDHTTDALAEGSTNLYYLDCRARQSLCGGTGVYYCDTSGEIAIGQDVCPTSNVAFADVTVNGRLLSDDVTASNVFICGDLTVTGTTTTVNSTTVDIADKNLTLACDATTGNQADGAGLTVCGANACFYWDNATNNWILNRNLTVAFVCGKVTDVSNHFTCDIAECVNLYYTDTRVRAALCGGTGVTYCETEGKFSIGQPVATTDCVSFHKVAITGCLELHCMLGQGAPSQTDKYLVGYNASECLWRAMPFCCFYNVDDPLAFAIAFSN